MFGSEKILFPDQFTIFGCIGVLVYLIVILHQLDNDADLIAEILDGDDSHDISGVLGVRIGAVLVGDDQHAVGQVGLGSHQVVGIHDGTLEKLHGGEVALEKPFQLQVWRLPVRNNTMCQNFACTKFQFVLPDGHQPVKENHLHIHIFSVFV